MAQDGAKMGRIREDLGEAWAQEEEEREEEEEEAGGTKKKKPPARPPDYTQAPDQPALLAPYYRICNIEYRI